MHFFLLLLVCFKQNKFVSAYFHLSLLLSAVSMNTDPKILKQLGYDFSAAQVVLLFILFPDPLTCVCQASRTMYNNHSVFFDHWHVTAGVYKGLLDL